MQRFNLVFILFFTFVLGQDRDIILFPHQYHVEDEELSCGDCHGGIELSVAVNDHAFLPLMDVCAECHEDEVDEDSDDADCTLCHTNEEDADTYPDIVKRSGPDFSHQLHLESGKDCFSCHQNIETDEAEDGRKLWADADCQACHVVSTPTSHDISWIDYHGAELTPAGGDACHLCHTESSCDQCHQLQQYAPKTHQADYLLAHGYDVRFGSKDCSTCHSLSDDCLRCHTEQQVMPMDHNFANWATIEGGMHTDVAMDEVDVCQSCHVPDDPTCYRCHN
ncbi:MAG: cytochrome c3 family protein [Candidatus Marinimicrobia bacterium]|nr:cytochrome c3 family protein [Candidatus Neomarinimicrobiota bacterium]